MAWLLLLAACERDPTLLGYWDIVAMRAGASEDTLEEVVLAGSMEFSNESCMAVYSYIWSNGWKPDPSPTAVGYGTDHFAVADFIESYKSEGETYTVTLTGGYSQANTFDILDWKGSSVTFASKKALPPGVWETTEDGTGQRMLLELDLER